MTLSVGSYKADDTAKLTQRCIKTTPSTRCQLHNAMNTVSGVQVIYGERLTHTHTHHDYLCLRNSPENARATSPGQKADPNLTRPMTLSVGSYKADDTAKLTQRCIKTTPSTRCQLHNAMNTVSGVQVIYGERLGPPFLLFFSSFLPFLSFFSSFSLFSFFPPDNMEKLPFFASQKNL
jgi:hypothetical protein